MTPSAVAPGLVAVLLALSAGAVQRRLHPSTAVRLLTVLAAMTALATVWAVALLAFGFFAQVRWVADRFGWCRDVFLAHDKVPVPVGALALVVLGLMAVSVAKTAMRLRRARWTSGGKSDLEVLPLEAPTAFAVPGRPGHVVVSVGMLRLLDADERRVLFAHERSHVEGCHHRYLRVAELAAAAAPVLRPVRAHLRFAVERWADEEAAAAVGDRRLVARAVARAALASTDVPAGAVAFDGLGVPGRVEALLSDDKVSSWPSGLALAVGLSVGVAGTVGSTVQLHHLVMFAGHVCGLN